MIFRSVCASAASCLLLASAACSSAATAPVGLATADGSVPSVADGSVPAQEMDSGAPATTGDAETSPPSDAGGAFDGPDLDMQASDFECILRWPKAGDFRITNKLVDAGASIAVADDDGGGGEYPVGTIIQLIPNEAMVKRHPGFSPSTNDWEFFNLSTSASGTVINQRGGAEVTNAIGSCATCHAKAAGQFDFVCGTTHGCTPLSRSPSRRSFSIQNGDPRCP